VGKVERKSIQNIFFNHKILHTRLLGEPCITEDYLVVLHLVLQGARLEEITCITGGCNN